MRPRTEFHEKLESVLGSKRVYFQPPEQLEVGPGDRIVYSLTEEPTRKANNNTYIQDRGYSVIFITEDPDSPIIDLIPRRFSHCTFGRPYVSDNLYHYIYTIFY